MLRIRVDLNELIELVREKYKASVDEYDVTPHVDFGDYGDGVQYENIYFTIQERAVYIDNLMGYIDNVMEKKL